MGRGMERPARPPKDRLPLDLSLVLWAIRAILVGGIFVDTTGQVIVASLGFYTVNYTVNAADLGVFLAIAALVALACNRKPNWNIASALAMVLIAIVAFNYLRGFTISPFAASFGMRVQTLPALMAIAIFVPRDERLISKIVQSFVVTALVLAALTFLRVIFGPQLFLVVRYLTIADINDGGRALSAFGATILAAGTIFTFTRYLDGRGRDLSRLNLGITGILLIALMLTGQGTARIGGLLALVICFACNPGPGRPFRATVALGAVIMVALPAFLLQSLLSPEALARLLPAFLTGGAERRLANFETRHLIWEGFLAVYHTWPTLDQVLGLPIGVKPTIVVKRWGGVYWQFSLHSAYIGALANTGALGLAAFVGLLASIAVANLLALGRQVQSRLTPTIGLAGCVLCATFGYSYELRNDQAAMLMLAMVAARAPIRTAAQRPAGAPAPAGGPGPQPGPGGAYTPRPAPFGG